MLRRVSLAGAAPGAIGLYWGESLISRVIRWGETFAGEGEKPPSHAFMKYSDSLILEARWPRISLRYIGEYPEDRVAVFDLPVAAAVKQAALEKLVATKLSHPYGLRTVAAFAVIEPMRHLGIVMPNYLTEKDADFCSELDAVYLSDIHAAAGLGMPADTDPAALYWWATH